MLKRRLSIVLKGMAMGTADLIPGVSGGTIAFITGIYERFIGALSKIDHRAVQFLFLGEFRKVIQRIDLWFLLTLLFGILTAVLSLARLIKYLIENYPIPLWAFFFGLIISSIVVVSRRVDNWKPLYFLWLMGGGIFAWYITNSGIIHTPDTAPYIFGAGFVSISAMMLPGISGSYILVILDKYNLFIGIMSSLGTSIQNILASIYPFDFPAMIKAVKDSQIDKLLIFYAGTFTGIITFSKLLNWLLHKYHNPLVAVLTGFMAGSLFKIWPWKRTLETYTNRHGEEVPLIEENILPSFYYNETWIAIMVMIFGALLVITLQFLAKEKKIMES